MDKKLLFAITISLLLITACSNKVKVNDSSTEEQGIETPENTLETIDDDLIKKIKEEEPFLDGEVYKKDGIVVGKFKVDKNVTDQEANKLADTYAKAIKAKYTESKINVQVVREGKEAIKLTVEKAESKDTTDTTLIPGIADFILGNDFPGFGKGTVIVKLDSNQPENYIVKVGETVLEFNVEFKDFSGVVPSTTTEADVKVLKK